MSSTDWAQHPVRALAYMGDAVFELHVRERTLRKGGNVDALHKATVGFVNAEGQAALARRLPELSERERAVPNHHGARSLRAAATLRSTRRAPLSALPAAAR